MIIKFPTGLYKTILPSEPNDGGNVTFTISNSPPPRDNSLFPKVTRGIVERRRTPKAIDIFTRLGTQGDLIFSVSSSSQSDIRNNANTFEIGQVLEFDDAPAQVVDPMYVSDKTETRHDTNKFDYAVLGLDDADLIVVKQQSYNTQQALVKKLNDIREIRTNAEVVIENQQKIINDTTRNINALQIIIDNSNETDSQVYSLVEKFTKARDAAFAARDAAKTIANQAAADAVKVQDQLRAVSIIVK